MPTGVRGRYVRGFAVGLWMLVAATAVAAPDTGGVAENVARPEAGWFRRLAALSGIGRPPPVVALDPGHGGRDPGASAPDGVYEKRWTLELARSLQDCLEGAGVRAELSRTSDHYVSLRDRAAWANRLGADLFVSIHLNAVGDAHSALLEVYRPAPRDPAARGTVVPGPRHWVPLPDLGVLQDRLGRPQRTAASARLADELHRALAGAVGGPGVQDRGVKIAHFMVLRETHMPAVLVEPATLSNPSQAARLHHPQFRRRLVQALCTGVLRYLAPR